MRNEKLEIRNEKLEIRNVFAGRATDRRYGFPAAHAPGSKIIQIPI